MLGKQTLKVEILEEAVALAGKKWISGGNSPDENGGR